MTYVPGLGMERTLAHSRSVQAAVESVMEAQRAAQAIAPVAATDRSRNPLRPRNLREIIGQEPAKNLLYAALGSHRRPLDHVLLVGTSGYGKSTFANALATELGVNVFQVEAPISHDTLLELRESMSDGDVLFIDEIHQQAIAERRGRITATQPEVLYQVLEDRVLPTATGVLSFPAITVVGATTDEGMLPDAFVNRFALRPQLIGYARSELTLMATRNAAALGHGIDPAAAGLIADASRGVPREVNNLTRTAGLYTGMLPIGVEDVRHALDMVGTSHDGLTRDMQAMVRFLYEKGRRVVRDEVRYQASVNTIATGIGKSRDSKAVALRVEPYLIERGYVQVAHGGRVLTDAGVQRAKELCV